MMRSIARGGWLVAIVFGVVAGCAADSGNDPDGDVLLHDDFLVPIARNVDDATAAQHAGTMTDNGLTAANHDEFYLAIRKSSLADQWFWSVYQKQTSLFGPNPGTLGTKVVRFAVQNDKLYVFDADIRRATSDVFSPDLIIDAFPIVHDDHFNSLPGSGGYVLIDPAAGMNHFGALADFWSFVEIKLTTELSFVQDFHASSDGGRYEQIVTAYSDQPIDDDPTNDNPYRVAATMGVNIRHYYEGAGYQQVAQPDLTYYFLSEPRKIPNTGAIEEDPEHWNFHPGMTPVKWVIGRELLALQADPNFGNGADLVGAVRRGIESWNDVFGYPVFSADLAGPNDAMDDDHVNYFIIDPDVSAGAAYADWRDNPNTGEIRGASIYFPAAFFVPFPDDEATAVPKKHAAPAKHPSLTWQGMTPNRLCKLDASDRDREHEHAPSSQGLTGTQKLELYIQNVAAHETGHTLGLRHNFKGSLMPPTSSVMEYNLPEVAFVQPNPGAYDRDAIRYLYGQSPDQPTELFCTDEDTHFDPDCQRFDAPSVQPLFDFNIPQWQFITSFFLDGSIPADDLDLNFYLGEFGAQMLDYTRVPFQFYAGSAWQAALDGVRPPLTPAQAADPVYAFAADGITAYVYRELFVAPDPQFEANFTPITDATTLEQIALDGGRIIENIDGVRSYATRRLVVDALKIAQNLSALEQLTAAKTNLTVRLPNLPPDDRLQTQDLLARIDAAISPYFN